MQGAPRILTSSRVLGGCCFDRGALYHLLRNRIYRGEVVHKGVAYPGEHKPIVDEELWNTIQARFSANLTERRQARIASGALLAGVIFDDRGHRMSPTYTVRRRLSLLHQSGQVHDPASAPMRSSNWWCRSYAANRAAMIKLPTWRAERGVQKSANWCEPWLIGSSSATTELKSRSRVTQSITPVTSTSTPRTRSQRPSGLLFLLPVRARARR